MKIAVISDIHSNLAALESVMESIGQKDKDSVICLGDIVGYGANPNECIDLIRDCCTSAVMGNHDEAALGRGDIKCLNSNARKVIRWTFGQLKSQSRSFLAGLKMTLRRYDLLFVHASPDSSQSWNYIFTSDDANLAFNNFQESVCFVGHTHYPRVFTEIKGDRRVINVGSVGQPRDHNPLACWGCYDTVTGEYWLNRIEYDVELSVKRIIDANLPPHLAYRLREGI